MLTLTTYGPGLPLYEREVVVPVNPGTFCLLEAQSASLASGNEATAVLKDGDRTVAKMTVAEFESSPFAEEGYG